MAYTVKNYKTKKELINDFKNGISIECFQPGIFPLRQGWNIIEGPHYPEPHKWYLSVYLINNRIVEIKGAKKKMNQPQTAKSSYIKDLALKEI